MYVIMSIILAFYLYTMLHVPETSQSFPKLHVHNDLILRRNKYYTYVRLRDLFCIISVCSLRLFSRFLSGVPKERFSDVGVSFQHTNQRYVNRLSSTVSLLYRTRSASSSFSQCATRRPMCLGVKVSCMGDR